MLDGRSPVLNTGPMLGYRRSGSGGGVGQVTTGEDRESERARGTRGQHYRLGVNNYWQRWNSFSSSQSTSYMLILTCITGELIESLAGALVGFAS